MSMTQPSMVGPVSILQQSQTDALLDHDGDEPGGKKKTNSIPGQKAKRRKVNHACLYCRRSHMTCDEGRPCQRCIKRDIGHLCHDEQRPPSKSNERPSAKSSTSGSNNYGAANPGWPAVNMPSNTASTSQSSYYPQNVTLGNEFSVLTDFLETLDDGSFFTPHQDNNPQSQLIMSAEEVPMQQPQDATTQQQGLPSLAYPPPSIEQTSSETLSTSEQQRTASVTPAEEESGGTESMPILESATKTERFLLIAADQEPGPRDERLRRVIRSKYEAGLLKPYNYVKGYARLSRWMDRNVSQESKQQILQPLSVLRPKFRAVAQSLRDIDLVFIEEAFERLMLDYDRVFSAMGVPACLWRRTGEIYKANREFAELVGLDGVMFREGRLCIYELMAEESAVNYWDKYGQIAFDSSQKAVLTSCALRYKPSINGGDETKQQSFVKCCFSFTIRRDTWGIPSMIVGNFIKC